MIFYKSVVLLSPNPQNQIPLELKPKPDLTLMEVISDFPANRVKKGEENKTDLVDLI